MSRAYEIIKCNGQNYACIVIPTSVTNPLERINCLIEQLNAEHIRSGYILFDFIISAGNSKERYASVLYDNGFVHNSFKYVDVKAEDPIRKKTGDFFREQIEQKELPMLSSSQIALLKGGFNI